MFSTTYRQLTTQQQKLAYHKLALRLKAPKRIVRTILFKINPPIKIVGQNVIMNYYTLDRIEQNIKTIYKP
jgi:hypothetical protein